MSDKKMTPQRFHRVKLCHTLEDVAAVTGLGISLISGFERGIAPKTRRAEVALRQYYPKKLVRMDI